MLWTCERTLQLSKSVDWSQTRGEVLFLNGSWDNTCKVWDPARPHSIATFGEHSAMVYGVAWSPRLASTFASVGGDGLLKVWDHRQPRATQTILAHDYEVLCCDWSKYDPHLVVTGSVDKTLRGGGQGGGGPWCMT
jgi:peroxin-7